MDRSARAGSGVDHVGHQRGLLPGQAELVQVPPRQQRGGQFVGERARRVVVAWLVDGN
jgi:hypothetical protein